MEKLQRRLKFFYKSVESVRIIVEVSPKIRENLCNLRENQVTKLPSEQKNVSEPYQNLQTVTIHHNQFQIQQLHKSEIQ